jgi:hypothetical protein
MTDKPKIDRAKYMMQDKKNETLTRYAPEINGFNFKIRNLDNCTVYLLDWTKGVIIIYRKVRCLLMTALTAR